MKKLVIIVLVGISCLNLMGASIWEGAAAMAAGGELPDSGYYIATNSFPRNTMVDVVNLENGKTLRVIVVGGIDTTGLLGILSKEAAAILGIEKGTIGRIRVNMPTDPIAFSRYTEGLNNTGDPDRDPAASISIAKAIDEQKTEPSPNSAEPPKVSTDSMAVGAQETLAPEQTGSTEPEAPQEETVQTPLADTMTSNSELPTITDALAVEDETITELPETKQEGVVPESSNEESMLAETTTQVEPEQTELAMPDAIIQDTAQPEATPEETLQVASSATEPAVETVEAPEITETPELSGPVIGPEILEGPVELSLEPAEERPPAVPSTVSPVENTQTKIDIRIQAEPVPEPVHGSGAVVVADLSPMTVPEPAPSPASPTVQTSPITTPTQSEATQKAVPQSSDLQKQNFSVPSVTILEKGKYYVQLGAFARVESVENLIKGLNKKYPLIVYISGTAEKPIYRLLIGPVNQGESSALVSYFKKSGFKDAFVKQEI